MISFKAFLERNKAAPQEELNEALITFGGKAYPKFGNIVILSGGAGSGKGFTLENLLGIEGKVLDVDAMKQLAKRTEAVIKAADKIGVDLRSLDMKNPADVELLHKILKPLVLDQFDEMYFNSFFSKDKSRLPNIIFDVTLKDYAKFSYITAFARQHGYSKENIHIVWVVNDFKVAIEQNAKRERVVPYEVLIDTHDGAQRTMSMLIDKGEALRTSMDGDIYFAFNKADVDIKFITRDDSDGKAKYSGKHGYIKDVLYLKIKSQGKVSLTKSEIGDSVLNKIRSYIPNRDNLKW